MDASNLLNSIRKHVMLLPEEEKYLLDILLSRFVKQNDVIEKSGEQTKCFIHVKSGCLMTYYPTSDGADQVIQFATAGWWTGDLHSISKGVPSIYTTRALADTEVFLLPVHSQEELLQKYPRLERYFRILYQNSLVTHQLRLIESFSYTAEQRYLSFREKYPSLEQYVPQKYIASYLGITPEFLSRLRRKLMEK